MPILQTPARRSAQHDLIETCAELGAASQLDPYPWWAQLPGFRSRNWWKTVLALPFYLWVAIGSLTSVFAWNLFGVIISMVGLGLFWLAADFKGARRATPGLRSPHAMTALLTWGGLLLAASFALSIGYAVSGPRTSTRAVAETTASATAADSQQVSPTEDVPTAAIEVPTPALAVPAPVAAPATVAPTATPDPAPMLAQLDSAWLKADWKVAIAVLERGRMDFPEALNYQDKLYVAHYNAGLAAQASGDTTTAVNEYGAAAQLDPSRAEAPAALLALTPVPTPAPVVPTPAPTADLLYLTPEHWIVGLDGPAFVSALSRRGIRCGQIERGVGAVIWSCSRKSTLLADYHLEIMGPSADRIDDISAAVTMNPPDDGMALTFFDDIIEAMDYSGRQAGALTAWMSDQLPHVGRGVPRRVTVGEAQFELNGPKTARILSIGGVGELGDDTGPLR